MDVILYPKTFVFDIIWFKLNPDFFHKGCPNLKTMNGTQVKTFSLDSMAKEGNQVQPGHEFGVQDHLIKTDDVTPFPQLELPGFLS